MAKVVVIGSGPAGLAAAEAVLDGSAGAVEVELRTLEHHLGGKACSWRDAEGRVVEHGQHLVLGFYRELRALLKRSGVALDDTVVSSRGDYLYWEDRDQRTHHLHVGAFLPKVAVDWIRYDGFTEEEKHAITAWVVRLALDIGGPISEELDDVCFTAWALSRGLPPSVAATNLFRAEREAQLNWPGEISAYAMLKTLKKAIGTPGNYVTKYPAGGMTELWWNPIARRIESLGGTIVRRSKLVGLDHEGSALTGLRFAMPQYHGPGKRYEGSVPTVPGSEERVADFDAAIVAIPVSGLQEILPPSLAAVRGLSGIPRLKTVAPLALQVWHSAKARVAPGRIVGGLEPPLGFAMDNRPNYPEYRDDTSVGSVLHFAGQLTGFEDDDDETIFRRAMESLRRIEGFEELDIEGVRHYRVLRHSSPHARYWDAEPGSARFKPEARTPVAGLYLAGDWIRNDNDFPCMETAVLTGRNAAERVLEDLDRAARVPPARKLGRRRRRLASLLGAGMVLAALAGCAPSPLHQVPAGRTVVLPDDHGPHAWAQTEWWHVHAHLEDLATGEPVHLFAGFVMERTDLDRAAGLPIAPIVNPYHTVYVQVVADGKAAFSEGHNFPSLVGAEFVGDGLDLRVEGRRVAWEGGTVVFEGGAGRHHLRLKLAATQPATLPGAGGATEVVPGTRHLWYQQERMRVSGMWRDGADVRWVEGDGFFKHQFGRLYDPDVEGFEWVSMDLPDGRSLVVVLVQEDGVRGVRGSKAWVSEAGGAPSPLDVDAVRLDRLETWRSPRSGAVWPTAWHITGEGLDLVVRAVAPDQELTVFPAALYAGPARVRGTAFGVPVETFAFIEQVGAWVPALRPLYRSDPPPEAEREASR